MTGALSKVLVKQDYEDVEAWFVKEVNSGDGLTLVTFKNKMQDIAEEHGYTMNSNDWDMISKAFKFVDVDHDDLITPEEFAAAMGS